MARAYPGYHLLFTAILGFSSFAEAKNKSYADKVDPFIGTGEAGEGQTFPGAVRPWGMASVSPHTNYTARTDFLVNGLISSSGYVHGQANIDGFGQTHLSGTGCPALGAPLVHAISGQRRFSGLSSPYSQESAKPGYYSVFLDRYDTKVEVTATKRVGVHRFTFPKGKPAHILINTHRNLSWASKTGFVEFTSDTEMRGWSTVGNFCNQGDETRLYFSARVNRKPSTSGTWQGFGLFSLDKRQRSGSVGAWLTYDEGQQVELYIGLSYTSMENATNNLRAEMTGEYFSTVAESAKREWNQELGKIEVGGGSKKDETQFYTALYHALIHPNIISDVNGDYPLYEKSGTGNNTKRPRYSVFSLWDTYRNLHALLSLVYPKQQQDMLLTLEDMTHEAGHAPHWELAGKEVNMMVGDPALSVIAEGQAKGFTFQDSHKLFEVLFAGATKDDDSDRLRPSNKTYRQIGYVPEKTSSVWGSVSTTEEYTYHDWALAQMAQKLGYPGKAKVLLEQASGWEELFDESTVTLRPKDRSGNFLEPFVPTDEVGEAFFRLGGPGFVEGTAFQYAYMLPHGIDRLRELHGSDEAFVANLRKVFNDGQFVMWNEPDLAYPYLFTYVPKQLPLTQKLVAQSRARFFNIGPDGLPGNDDAGVMSSWFIFSALGFYPVNPASAQYALGIPLFSRAIVHLAEGRDLQIHLAKSAKDGSLSGEVELNKAPLAQSVTHAELVQGGELRFL